MRFKKQENRAIQQLILGGLALICAGLLYLATVKQVTEAQFSAPKTQVKEKKTETRTSETTTSETTTSQEITVSEATQLIEDATSLTEAAYQPPVIYAPVVEPVYTEAVPVETIIVEVPVETPAEEVVVETENSGG